MFKYLSVTVFLLFNSLPSLFSQLDTDNDGMSDDWEMANGLDENDPTDAFSDGDGDNVLNLQEFILGADPSDIESPVIYNHSLDNPLENIYSRMRTAGTDVAVIRMAEGEYDFLYASFADGAYKLMLQGGWNSDFTEYNPCKYPTILNHGGGPTGTISLASLTGESISVVIDGLEFKNAAANISSLELISDGGPSQIHLHNSIFDGSAPFGFLASGRFNCPSIDVTISSSVFVNHAMGGITFASDGNPVIDARIINCTLDNPEATSGGVDFRSIGGPTETNVKIVNSIVWNNGPLGPFAQAAVWDGLTINAENCALPEMEYTFTVNESNTFDIAPEFNDALIGDYSLVDSSPLIDAGLNTGLPFIGNAIDIGALESNNCLISASEELQETVDIHSFPNPVIDRFFIELDPSKSYDVEMTDVKGLALETKQAVRVDLLELDMTSYARGIYFLRINDVALNTRGKEIKVIKL